MTERMLTAVIDTIQMETGIGRPILEDCRPIDYIEWGWIPQIRDFLHHINGCIVINKNRPKTYREHDSYLMDSEYLKQITHKRTNLYPSMPHFSTGGNGFRHRDRGRTKDPRCVEKPGLKQAIPFYTQLATSRQPKPRSLESLGKILAVFSYLQRKTTQTAWAVEWACSTTNTQGIHQ
jgi:hypothetical protein